LGSVFVILCLAKGVQYKQVLPIDEPWMRAAACAVGVLLIVYGVFRTSGSSVLPKTSDYEIKITHPSENASVGITEVKGTFKKKKLPDGYTLRILRIYFRDGGYVPLERALISEDGTWIAAGCDIGGKPGEGRYIGVYLIGPAGKILLDSFQTASAHHHRTCSKNPNYEPMPPLMAFTSDMIECRRISVVRS
jgi:hypothetical protein